MGMNKEMKFDVEYKKLLNMCIERGQFGSDTFFVDMNMSDFTMQSCIYGEAMTTDLMRDYFERFNLPDMNEISCDFMDDGDDYDE